MSGLRFVGYRNNKLNRKGLKDIYKEAFPREEKIPFWMLKMLTRDGEENSTEYMIMRSCRAGI